MSYILDALQRADAERARGAVPTLHARPVPTAPATPGLSQRQRAGLASAVTFTIAAAALAWWLWSPVAQQQAAEAQLPAAAPATAVLVPLPAPAPVPNRAVAAVTAAKPMTSASAVEPAPAAVPPAKAVVVASAPVVVTETPAPAPTLAPLLSELPDATRRQIPTLAISGAVYSENPSQRLLLVNGLVLNQGGQAAQDVTVVEIRSNNSEFSFKGTRFRLAH